MGCGRTWRFDCIFRVQTAFGRAPSGSIVVNNHQILGFWGVALYGKAFARCDVQRLPAKCFSD